MRRIALFAVLAVPAVAVMVIGVVPDRDAPPAAPAPSPSASPTPTPCGAPEIVAHRGFGPENTLVGIRGAARVGADVVEVDVHTTRDGMPVLMHDDTVDRTTEGTGRVDELTWREVSRLDVPRLRQALAALGRTDLDILLEVKAPENRREVTRIVRTVQRSQVADRVTVESFDPGIVKHAEKLGADTGLITSEPAVSRAERLGVEIYSPKASELADVPDGVEVAAWTVDEPAGWDRLAAMGVDAVITDQAKAAVKWREKRCIR